MNSLPIFQHYLFERGFEYEKKCSNNTSFYLHFISLVQAIFFGEYHFLDITECLVATLIAWIVGWQYDKLRLFAKERKKSEQNYKKLIEWLPKPVIIHQDSIILFVNKAAEK